MSAVTTVLPQLFSGELRPFPGIPAEWSETKRETAAAILVDVEHVFPEELDVDADADIEDFWEDACRVSAGWLASGGSLVAKTAGSQSVPAWDADEMSRRLGPVSREEDGGHHGADKYINDPIVQEHGGRAMFLGSIQGAPGTCILEWLASRHRDFGVQRGVVKAAAHKNGIWSIELDSDPEVISQRLLEAMDWTYIRLQGGVNEVFAQDAIELQWEYRLFVVDGELVSGAGCVEEFTPLDRDMTSGPFDSMVRRIRGHLHQGNPSPVEDRPEIVRQLIEFGEHVAKQHGGTVVIDVALDAGTADGDNPLGTPVVIELNAISNSGLFASDPWAVAKALVQARDRGYQL